MLVYLVLVLAVLSRLLPPMLHFTAMNFTAVGGSLLFLGSKRSPWVTAAAVVTMMGTDFFLTSYVYHYPFHVLGYLVTWAWYAGVCVLGSGLLARVSVLRVLSGVVVSATSFFVLSNFMVFLGHMYPHTGAGLIACYVAALPFYQNDLVSTGIVAGALFGLPVLASRLVEGMRGQQKAA
jgi:hypothetical protein